MRRTVRLLDGQALAVTIGPERSFVCSVNIAPHNLQCGRSCSTEAQHQLDGSYADNVAV